MNERKKDQVMNFRLFVDGMVAAALFACPPFCLARGGGGHYVQPFGGPSYPGYSSNSYSYDSTPYPYTPTPEQWEVAKKRVKTYYAAIRKGRRPARHRYIAVETLRPTKKQTQDYLKRRLAAKGAQDQKAVDTGQLRCVMVFDTQKQQFVGSKCYLVDHLPSAGTVTQFESIGAEYVGQL